MALTLAEANRIVQAAITKAQEMNIKVSAAVCDAGGRLIAFNRMDGAIWGSVYGSQGKAIASAAFGRASGELTERAGTPIIQGIVAAERGARVLILERERQFRDRVRGEQRWAPTRFAGGRSIAIPISSGGGGRRR